MQKKGTTPTMPTTNHPCPMPSLQVKTLLLVLFQPPTSLLSTLPRKRWTIKRRARFSSHSSDDATREDMPFALSFFVFAEERKK